MINGTAEQFQKFANDYNKAMMDSWSNWTKQTVQSDSFASASGAFMDWSLATHKMMTELSGQVMESLDVPKRSDLARLSAQVQSVETRLLEQEETSEEIRDLLLKLIAKVDDVANTAKAPVVAASPAAASSVAAAAREKTVDEVTLPVEKPTKAPRKPAQSARRGKAGNKS